MFPLKNNQRQFKRKNEEKWTKPIMDAGWLAFPNIFLLRQRALDLDAIDINIILHLAMYWWEKDKPPFPSKKVIADSMQIDVSTVRKRIAKMEKAGYIKRVLRNDPINGQRSNEYILEGLIEAATPLAEEEIEAKKQKKIDEDARRKRKSARSPKPKLSAVL